MKKIITIALLCSFTASTFTIRHTKKIKGPQKSMLRSTPAQHTARAARPISQKARTRQATKNVVDVSGKLNMLIDNTSMFINSLVKEGKFTKNTFFDTMMFAGMTILQIKSIMPHNGLPISLQLSAEKITQLTNAINKLHMFMQKVKTEQIDPTLAAYHKPLSQFSPHAKEFLDQVIIFAPHAKDFFQSIQGNLKTDLQPIFTHIETAIAQEMLPGNLGSIGSTMPVMINDVPSGLAKSFDKFDAKMKPLQAAFTQKMHAENPRSEIVN